MAKHHILRSEDLARYMVSFTAFNLTFKFFLTTKTLYIQKKQERKAKESLINFVKCHQAEIVNHNVLATIDGNQNGATVIED